MQINYNRLGESSKHLEYVGSCVEKLINLLANIQIPEDEEGKIDLSILNTSAGSIATEAIRTASLIGTFIAGAKTVDSQVNNLAFELTADFNPSSVMGDGVFETDMTAEEFNKLLENPFKEVNSEIDKRDKIEFDNQTVEIKPEKYGTVEAPTAKNFWETIGLSAANVGGGVLKYFPNMVQFAANNAGKIGDPGAMLTSLVFDTAKNTILFNNDKLGDIWNSDSDIATKLKATGAEIFSTASATINGGLLSDPADFVVAKMEDNAATFYDDAFDISEKTKMWQEAAGENLAGAAMGLGMESMGFVPKSSNVQDVPNEAKQLFGAAKDFFKNRGTNNSGFELVVDEVIDMNTGAKIYEYRYVPTGNGSSNTMTRTGAESVALLMDGTGENGVLLPAVVTDSNNMTVTGGNVFYPMSTAEVNPTFLPAVISNIEDVERAGTYTIGLVTADANVMTNTAGKIVPTNVVSSPVEYSLSNTTPNYDGDVFRKNGAIADINVHGNELLPEIKDIVDPEFGTVKIIPSSTDGLNNEMTIVNIPVDETTGMPISPNNGNSSNILTKINVDGLKNGGATNVIPVTPSVNTNTTISATDLSTLQESMQNYDVDGVLTVLKKNPSSAAALEGITAENCKENIGKVAVEIFKAIPEENFAQFIEKVDSDWLFEGYNEELSTAHPEVYTKLMTDLSEIKEFGYGEEVKECLNVLAKNTNVEAVINNFGSIQDFVPSESGFYMYTKNVYKSFHDTIFSRMDQAKQLEYLAKFEEMLVSPNVANQSECYDMLEVILSNSGEDLLRKNGENVATIIRNTDVTYKDATILTKKILDGVPDDVKKSMVDSLLVKLQEVQGNGTTKELSKFGQIGSIISTNSGGDFFDGNTKIMAQLVARGGNGDYVESFLELVPEKYGGEIFNNILDELLKYESLNIEQSEILSKLVDTYGNDAILNRADDIRAIMAKADLLPKTEDKLKYIANKLDYIEGKSTVLFDEFAQKGPIDMMKTNINDITTIVETEIAKNPNIVNENDSMSLAYQIYMRTNGDGAIQMPRPSLEKYRAELASMEKMDPTKLSQFLKDVERIRSVDGTMPEECCDYIIRQKIDTNSYFYENMDKYGYLYKRAMEDKTRHIANRNGVDNILVTINARIGDDGTLGGKLFVQKLDSFAILYKESNMMDKRIAPIDTMYHELEHVMQDTYITSGNYNEGINLYRMAKEDQLRLLDETYYKENYWDIYKEIEARIAGRRKLRSYMKKIKIDDMDSWTPENQEKFMKTFMGKMELEREKLDKTAKFKISNGQERDMDVIFNEKVEKNPWIRRKNNIFEIEYDAKGKRRPSFEILKEFDQKASGAGTFDELQAYHSIFKEDYFGRNCENESVIAIVKQDLELLSSSEVTTNWGSRMKDLIIENELVAVMESPTAPVSVRNDIYTELETYIENNPESKIADKIQKSLEKCKDEILQTTSVDGEQDYGETSDKVLTQVSGDIQADTLADYSLEKDIPAKSGENLAELSIEHPTWDVTDSHSDETIEELKNVLANCTDEQTKNHIIERIAELEESYGTQLQYLDRGQNSVVFELGDVVLKFGRPQDSICPLGLEDIETIPFSNDKVLRVIPKMDTSNMTIDELQYVYNQLRDSGYIWTDAHVKNIGRIPGSNGDKTGLRIIDDENVRPEYDDYSAFDVLFATGRSDLFIREYYYQKSINPKFKLSDINDIMKINANYRYDPYDFLIDKYDLQVRESELQAAPSVIEWLKCELWNEKHKKDNVCMINKPGFYPKLYMVRDENGETKYITKKNPLLKVQFEKIIKGFRLPGKVDINDEIMLEDEFDEEIENPFRYKKPKK